jgi:hypothetical protein
MRTIERRQYEMLARVCGFGEQHADLFPTSSLAADALGSIVTSVEQMAEFAVSKTVAAETGKEQKANARQALIEQLEAISRTARGIAMDTEGLANTFLIPRGRADQALVTTGHVFARDAEPYKATFLAHGMPATFIEDLRDRVVRFEQAIRAREKGKNGHRAAIAAIGAALSSGNAAAQKLDVILANLLRDDPGAMAVWTRDRQVERPRRRRRRDPQRPTAAATSVGDVAHGGTA